MAGEEKGNAAPTSSSVTTVACKCQYLERISAEPGSPVVFNPELDEFEIKYTHGHVEHSLPIHHCPFCGGTGPRSKRALAFAEITSAEKARLNELVAGLRSVEQVIARFGPPDDDFATGFSTTSAGTEIEAPVTVSYRLLRYKRLSETADIAFVDYGPEFGLRPRFEGKYIGPPKG